MHTTRSSLHPHSTGTADRAPDRLSLSAGSPRPLGAHWDGHGTNFSVFSEIATGVTLSLFDGGKERQLPLHERTNYCWHAYAPGIGPGQEYGYRVEGPWNPAAGHRCNPAKLLIDPYARAIDGDVTWRPEIFPHEPDSDGETRNDADSAPYVPRSVVIDETFEWAGDRPLGRALADTVIYEAHVRGFSMRNPDVPPELRGTYLGLAHPASIAYFRTLGITAVELLPVHHFLSEPYLLDRGLTNYWGYDRIGFFAPHARYASGGAASRAVLEFKTMVKALHEAGIEVLLDVVYNHTAEGNHQGAMLAFKGLDNAAYYRLMPDSPRHYRDFTGVGNTLNLRHPQVVQLVTDSLRYWVSEMHVDGFRFDLAVALSRGDHHVDPWCAFLTAVRQDPALASTKLIAEPWDLGEGGYQVGGFPVGWSEWNGRYRDTVRDYWRSQGGTLGDFATRLTGSADLYKDTGRAPTASINLVTAHDGFTMHDLVAYQDKHNEANGEENRDGPGDNRSWNLGVEGPTDNPDIVATRARQVRNFLATLLLSHGVPMLVGGDEMGHTQGGNNNPYCQDNDVTWLDWEHQDAALIAFVRRAIALRRTHGAFERRIWPAARPSKRRLADVAWFHPRGTEMTPDDWTDGGLRAIGLFLDDRAEGAARRRGPHPPERFLLLASAALEPVTFHLPSRRWGHPWIDALDSATGDGAGSAHARRNPGEAIERPPLSLLVLRCPRTEAGGDREER